MIVRPASRMSSAISFGVFWRSAPSTSAIIRSRKLSPGFAVTRTTIWSESTRVPPVTAERSPPDSRITGADSPVIADSSTLAMPFDHLAVGRDHLAGGDDDLVADREARELGTSSIEPSGRRRCAIVSARVLRSVVGLGLAPPLGHRLGEVGEQHGEPEPGRDRARRRRSGSRESTKSTVDEDAADLDDEHDRVPRHPARVELRDAVAARAAREDRAGRAASAGSSGRHSARGAPRSGRARARGSRSGRRRSARRRRAAPAKSGVPVGNVPAVAGTGCLRASDPAMASTGTISRKRPPSIARPSVVLYQSVLPVSPPKAEPLLFAADVKA